MRKDLDGMAHSQGAAILNQALKYLTSAELGRIDLVTFGAAKLFKNRHLGSVTHFISRCDFIPLISDPIGYFFAWIGFRPDVRFIGPRFAPPLQEHMLSNKTYREAAAETARDWLDLYGEKI